MKIITSTILVTALATQLASAQTTAQPLPPLPTTPGYAAQPIYAPAQQQAQQQQAQQQAAATPAQQPQQMVIYNAPAATTAPAPQTNPLITQTPAAQPAPQAQAQQFQPAQQAQFAQPAFAPAPAAQPAQQAYAPAFAPAPQPYTEAQQQQFTQPAFAPAPAAAPATAPVSTSGLWPAGPSVTVAKRPAVQAAQPAFAQAAPQELPMIAPAQPQWQGQQQPAQQQFQPAPAPQQLQQFQPAAAPQAQQFQQAAPQQQFQQQQQWQPAPAAAAQPAPQQFTQPQPIQQLQPASGQAPQQMAIAPQPIAVPAPQPVAEPAPIQSASVNITPSLHSGTSLYMLGSISSSVPMAKASLPKDSYKTLDEDAWRQVEFVPATNGTSITNQISQIIDFKQQNWAGNGFRQVLVRPELPYGIAQLGLPKSRLPKTKATSLALRGGSVSDGFTISDAKSGWFMYGQKSADGKITSLSISPDDMPMSEAFAKQIVSTAGTDLILVDWYKDTIVDTRNPKAVLDWASVYKPADLVKQ